MKSHRNKLLAAGLAVLLAAPAGVKAIEVYNKDNSSVDLGLRYQLLGVMEYQSNPDYVAAKPVSTSTGNGNRDDTRILLFQKQNRLKVNADLDGVKVKFENAMGSEGYAG